MDVREVVPVSKVLLAAAPVGAVRSRQAVQGALARGLARVGATVETMGSLPLLDGGQGTLESLVRALGGRIRRERLALPTGGGAEVSWARLADGTIYVEASEALAGGRGDSQLLGWLLTRVARLRPARVWVGLGGCWAGDGGRGLLSVLESAATAAGEGPNRLWPADIPLRALYDVPWSWQALVERPALWPKGAPPRRQWLSQAEGVRQRLGLEAQDEALRRPGTGGGGGLGLALWAVGAELAAAGPVLMSYLGANEALSRADWVLAAVHSLGDQDPASHPLAALCGLREHPPPVVAVCYELGEDYPQWFAQGVIGLYPLHDRLRPPTVAWRRTATLLEAAAYRVGMWMERMFWQGRAGGDATMREEGR